MRMGPDARRSAEEIVNTWSELALKNLLHTYGELHCGGGMAEDIVRVCSPPAHVIACVYGRLLCSFVS